MQIVNPSSSTNELESFRTGWAVWFPTCNQLSFLWSFSPSQDIFWKQMQRQRQEYRLGKQKQMTWRIQRANRCFENLCAALCFYVQPMPFDYLHYLRERRGLVGTQPELPCWGQLGCCLLRYRECPWARALSRLFASECRLHCSPHCCTG